jgi:hypothetical protein
MRAPPVGKKDLLTRGALWGLLASVGILTKVTFGYFAALVFPLLFYITWRRSGWITTLRALSVCVLVSVPAIAFWSVYGAQFLNHATSSAWGNFAENWKVVSGPMAKFARYAEAAGVASGIVLASIVLAVAVQQWRRRSNWTDWAPLAIVLGYVGIALTSPNDALRLLVPATLSLPFSILPLLKTHAPQDSRWPISGLLVPIFLSVPMIVQVDTSASGQIEPLLKFLSERDIRNIVLAGDRNEMNRETFLLAQQLGGEQVSALKISTVVYDSAIGIPPELSFQKLRNADAVIIIPPPTDSPFAMIHLQEFENLAEKIGRRLEGVGPNFLNVFVVSASGSD